MHEIRLGRQEDHVTAKFVTKHDDIQTLEHVFGLRCLVVCLDDNPQQPVYEIRKSDDAETWLNGFVDTTPIDGCRTLARIIPPKEDINCGMERIKDIILFANVATVFYHQTHEYGIIIEGEPCESDNLPIRKTIVTP